MKRVLTMIAVLALVTSVPVGFSADFNGDGTNDIGIFRPSTGLWAIRDGARVYFGGTGDEPVPGDYDGDGTVDIAIFRPSTGLWAVNGGLRTYFGGSGDVPLAGISGGGGGGSLWSQNGDKIYFTGPGGFGTGEVGIGLTTPRAPLEILVNSTISYPQLILHENDHDYARLSFERNGNENFFTLAAKSESDTDTANARMHIYYNKTGDLMSFTGEGKVGIGTDNPTAALQVSTQIDGDYAARFFNDGGQGGLTGNHGIRIRCGSDTGAGTSYLVWFAAGNNTHIGDITFTAGNVAYNNFTAEHTAKLPTRDNEKGYPYGTVMSLVSKQADPERPRQDSYTVQPSVKAYDKAVFGIYAGKRPDEENNHSIYAIGDGHILVTREGGNIESGDYLTTSSKSGHAMKQDDDLRHSYTVAKALEAVDWENEASVSKLIGCTYQTQ